ncbi:hypothetical protein JAAARDRAFT_188497 [Jaapia argillacea MUCL 33604]|uniref:F-box domain-containing protein n=1 Tax=Jaapia argillacea MUCL 33604 TaxID=933084 RepID=A0A067Q9M2_9AGAM|nr:hypothetical protein JAAARDRAFT_188497 [Jaapia argillacea MUCL 33604]
MAKLSKSISSPADSTQKRKNIQPALEDDGEKSRVKKRSRRGMTFGDLTVLLRMPMDILFKVLGHLLPLDLLNLSRTNKEFRLMIMSRTSLHLWKVSFDQFPGIPECRPNTSTPRWASLVFEQHCHNCLKSPVRVVEWRLGVRYCARCAKSMLCEESLSPYDSDSLGSLLPHRVIKDGRRGIFVRSQLEEMQNSLGRLPWEKKEAFKEERKTLVQRIHEHADRSAQWALTQAHERSHEIDAVRHRRKEAIVAKLTALGWGDEVGQIAEVDSLEKHKFVKAPKPLTERIWENIKADLVSYMEEMRAKRLIRERLALLNHRKAITIGVLRAYKASRLDCCDVFPGPPDFCGLPEVKAIVDRPSESVVNEGSFTDIVAALPELIEGWRGSLHRQLVNRIVAQQEGRLKDPVSSSHYRLYSLTPEGHRIVQSDKPHRMYQQIMARIRLASTVFKCDRCSCTRSYWASSAAPMRQAVLCGESDGNPLYILPSPPLFYPQVFGHRCLCTSSQLQTSLNDRNDPSTSLGFSVTDRSAWSSDLLRVDFRASKFAEEIVRVCGLDPMVATAKQMDDMFARVVCVACAVDEEEGFLEGMNWRAAIHHATRRHIGDEDRVQWHKLPENDSVKVRNLEANMIELFRSSPQVIPTHSGDPTINEVDAWSCFHCLDLPCERGSMSLHDVQTHVRNQHGQNSPAANRDFFKALEAWPEGMICTPVRFEATASH